MGKVITEFENFPYYDACLDCKHLLGSMVDPTSPPNQEAFIISFCAAFPKGIPEVIQSGENWHRTNIRGDLGIKYERGINPVSNSDQFPEEG